MRNLVGKLRTVVFGQEAEKGVQMESEFEFIKNRKSILKELERSKSTGGLLGIVSEVLGDGMFITAVEDIHSLNGRDQIITLKPYDMTGHIFSRTGISLGEIRSVVPFKAFYRNPFLSQHSN